MNTSVQAPAGGGSIAEKFRQPDHKKDLPEMYLYNTEGVQPMIGFIAIVYC